MLPEGWHGLLDHYWCEPTRQSASNGRQEKLERRLNQHFRIDSYSEGLLKNTGLLISVVDDDESVRDSLPELLREFGFTVKAFSSATEFLSSDCVSQTKCLILDVAMPGMSGPDLQLELRRQRQDIPIIFITAPSSDAVRSRLLKQGAIECLFKPFTDSALLDALKRSTTSMMGEQAGQRTLDGSSRSG